MVRNEGLLPPDEIDAVLVATPDHTHAVAVLAAFGARAAANRTLKLLKPDNWKTEGAIAVHA